MYVDNETPFKFYSLCTFCSSRKLSLTNEVRWGTEKQNINFEYCLSVHFGLGKNPIFCLSESKIFKNFWKYVEKCTGH